MKSLQTICLLFVTASFAAAQQYTITTVAGIPQQAGLFPTVNPNPAVPAVSVQAPAVGPSTGGGQLYDPSVVFVDSKNNIYIANNYTFVVDMVSAATGKISIIGGDGTPGTAGDGEAATSANINDIHGIAVDSSGNVYISDTSTCRIRRIDNPATNSIPNISTFAGKTTSPFCGATSGSPFAAPGALAFDSKGNLYVADYGNSTVRMITPAGAISTFAGTLGSYGNAGDGGAASSALLAYPVSLTFDAAGNLYIGDEGNSNIRKVDSSGNISTVATGVNAQGLGIDAAGNIYYVDGVSSTVKKMLPGGGTVVIAGTVQDGYAGDGDFNGTAYTGSPASQALLNQPAGLCIGPDGTIYVADTRNDVIRHLVAVPSSLGVQDSASEAPGSLLRAGAISPGEILTLFGSGLGPSTLTQFSLGPDGRFPTQIAGTSVTFNGTPAPLIYASDGLVAAIAPYGITGSGTANIVLTYQGKTSSASVPVVPSTPAVFTANTTGTGQAAAVNVADGLVNSTAHPAHLGGFIELFVTGTGYTTAPADGQPASVTCGVSCLPVPLLPVTVKIGNQTVTPTYAGGAPSLVAGVTQVNVQIPTTLIPGPVLVQVLVDGYPSQGAVTIAVAR